MHAGAPDEGPLGATHDGGVAIPFLPPAVDAVRPTLCVLLGRLKSGWFLRSAIAREGVGFFTASILPARNSRLTRNRWLTPG